MHKAYNGDTVPRRVKNPESEWERRRIPIPAAVKDCNRHAVQSTLGQMPQEGGEFVLCANFQASK